MKKNRMMRLASVLLVLTLLSTSVISGTFAKYVTSESTTDSARVAKWGVVASVKGDLFGQTYAAASDNNIIDYNTYGGTVSADKVTDFVVAPGTQNIDAMTISISGTPEVASKVIVDSPEDTSGTDYTNSDIYLTEGDYGVMVKIPVSDIILTKENKVNYYTLNGTNFTQIATDTDISAVTEVYELHDKTDITDFTGEYHPLQWYVKGDTTPYSFADIKDKVVNAFKESGVFKTFTPNQTIDTSITIGWEWAFGEEWNDESDYLENTSANDRKDTILGNMMALYGVASPDFYVVKDLTAVTYEEVSVGANKIVVAKAGTDTVACLTASYNVRVTVTQVD